MMGGCQSGFCQMKIERIMEEEGCEDITYMYPGSWVVDGKVRNDG